MSDAQEMFSVPPEWTEAKILEATHQEIDWAMTSGAYAPPEVWFGHIPALVALLKATTALLEERSGT